MVVPLRALEHASQETYGSKAWMLFEALRRGYRVPAGMVVPTHECEKVMACWRAEHAVLLERLLSAASPDECLHHSDVRGLTLPAAFGQQLASAVRTLRAETGSSRLIVRSSAQAEDSGARSHAGQFHSEADVVSEEEIQSATRRVLLNYLWRRERNLAEGGIAVILQVQVASDLSGVAFSCNPVSGDPDEMVIAYRKGECGRVTDGLASAAQVSIRLGQTEPDAWEVVQDTARGDTEARDPAIKHFAAAIVHALTDFERLLESPVDIEWTVAQGDLYLLQVRPVTKVAFRRGPLADLQLDGGWYERCTARPIHPNSWHWLGVSDQAHPGVFQRFGEQYLQVTHRVINGYVYRRVRVDRSRYDEARQRELALSEGPLAMAQWDQEKGRLLSELRRLNRAPVALLPLPELKACYRHIVDLATHAQCAHDTLQRPIGIASWWVQELAESLAGYDELQSVALLDEPGGLGSELKERVSAVTVDRDTQTVPAAQLREIAYDFGYQFASFSELYDPLSWETWEEDPAPLRLLCLAQHQETRHGNRKTRRRQVLEARRALLARTEETDPEAGALLRRVLELALQYMAVRVDKDLCLSFAFAVHRKYLTEIGVRVFGRDGSSQVFAATMGEVLEFCASDKAMLSPRTLAAIERRCRRRHVFEKMSAPPKLPVPTEPGEQETGTVIRDVLEGTPGAAGTAIGRVRVLRGIRDIATLEAGEVMVIPDIKPAWALAFPMASGIISAHGHLLAHGAIMAREAGIPCVYVGEAVNSLRTGDLVRVLGEQGRVEVISRAM